MAICNLFVPLNSKTGTFLTFSQYNEDLTRNMVDGQNYKVVPSKFLACDIQFQNHDVSETLQNYFENGCAVCRKEKANDWTPNMSSNLFWDTMFNQLNFKTDDIKFIEDINFYSYNEYDGVGYSEIYCYLPENANIIKHVTIENVGDKGEAVPSSDYLEGYENFEDKALKPNKIYYYPYYSYNIPGVFDKDTLNVDKVNINTIIVLYDIYMGGSEYKNIPLGIYFTGMVDSNTGTDITMTNTISKYISKDDTIGTSYGLRICSRYISTPNSDLITTSTIVEPDSTVGLSKVLSEISVVSNQMSDIVSQNYLCNQNYKELLSIFKNNRVNVPYIKNINGVNYWFVNGRKLEVSSYDKEGQNHQCGPHLEAYFEEPVVKVNSGEVKAKLNWVAKNGDVELHVISLKVKSSLDDEGAERNSSPIDISIQSPKNITTISYIVEAETSYGLLTATPQIKFTYPSYFRIGDTGNGEEFLTENANYVKTYDNQSNARPKHIYYMYPKAYGELTSITDARDIEYINDFELTEIQKNGIDYFQYKDRYPADVINYTLKFKR